MVVDLLFIGGADCQLYDVAGCAEERFIRFIRVE
jgi:hypothetical protein